MLENRLNQLYAGVSFTKSGWFFVIAQLVSEQFIIMQSDGSNKEHENTATLSHLCHFVKGDYQVCSRCGYCMNIGHWSKHYASFHSRRIEDQLTMPQQVSRQRHCVRAGKLFHCIICGAKATTSPVAMDMLVHMYSHSDDELLRFGCSRRYVNRFLRYVRNHMEPMSV